jgi:hypothetical protein
VNGSGPKIVFLLCMLLCAAPGFGQSGPVRGGSEIQVWTAGGHSVPSGTGRTGVFDAGLRYGWVLTSTHGPGFLKGSFEYAVDAVPLVLIFQPANTAYGVGINPVNLKWNFVRRGHVVPYFELGGGVVFTNHDVPPGTSSTNFTPTAAIGFHFLGRKFTPSIEARYLHISDAGLSGFNPGINSVQVRVGLGVFRHGH